MCWLYSLSTDELYRDCFWLVWTVLVGCGGLLFKSVSRTISNWIHKGGSWSGRVGTPLFWLQLLFLLIQKWLIPMLSPLTKLYLFNYTFFKLCWLNFSSCVYSTILLQSIFIQLCFFKLYVFNFSSCVFSTFQAVFINYPERHHIEYKFSKQ